MDDQQAFLVVIEKDPRNSLLRGVFADFLDERGEVEEADRQRKFCDAWEWLWREYFSSFYDVDGSPKPKKTPLTEDEKQLFEFVWGTHRINYFVNEFETEGELYFHGISDLDWARQYQREVEKYNADTAPDNEETFCDMSDFSVPEEAREFFENLEIVVSRRLPWRFDETGESISIHCAC